MAFFLFASGAARAQTVGSSGQYEGSNGIKLGEGRAHPYFDLELRYDSAAGFFNTSGGANSELKPEMIVHFRPGVRFELASPSVYLNLDGNVDYVWYTQLITKGSDSASRLQAAADLTANFNQGGSAELDLRDHFTRSDQTHNVALGIGVLSIYNEALASVPIRPGGKALEIAPNVGWSFENYQSISGVTVPNCDPTDVTCADPNQVNQFNYQNVRFGVDGRWRFLPKTAVTLNTQLDYRTYGNGNNNLPATLLRASLGLAGLISTKVATVVRLGWGQDFKNSGAHTLIAQAEVNYLVSDVSNVKVGYLRNLEPVPTFGIYGDDRGYLETRFLFSGRVSFHGYAAFDYFTYYGNSGGRKDTNVTLDLGPEYQVTKWLIGAAGYRLNVRGSNTSSAASVNFTRNEVYLRATFIY
ncbi:MAG TPA: hypothetical protein VKE49_05830 [Myxococcaceae bacterium]|nr:hypothetical protein [Myxococcaceae bacterium]